MFVLMFWILIIECMAVEIKVVYGNDRVIISIPVHIKKSHHAKTIYKIIERPAHAGLRIKYRAQPTKPGGPDRGRLRGRHGGGVEAVQGALVAANSYGAQRQSSHEERGNTGTPALAGYRDRGHGAPRTASYGLDFAPRGYRGRGNEEHAGLHEYGRDCGHATGEQPYRHGHRCGGAVIRVFGDHKHGHYGDVMYVGDHEPKSLLSDQKPKPLLGDQKSRGRHGGPRVPVGFPVVAVPPPPSPPPRPRHQHGQNASPTHDGGYQVRENVADFDDRPPPTTSRPLPSITVSPADNHHSFADGVSPVSSPLVSSVVGPPQTAIPSTHTAVSHVYYTLDPVVPYDDVTRPSSR